MGGKKSIIYCSSLISNRMMTYLFQTSTQVPMQSAFKFNKLFVEGFSMNQCNVFAVSSIPVIPSSHRKRFWALPKEVIGAVHYWYAPIINISFLKHVMVFIYAFFSVFYLRLRSGLRAYAVIDVLNSSISSGALAACKLTMGKSIGIVTDLPQLLQQTLNISRLSFIEKSSIKLNEHLIKHYDGYVFLTDHMNKAINPKNKPSCIIEGLVDINMQKTGKSLIKDKPRVILYSGGIYEKYGVKMLLEAFMSMEHKDIQLSIFGTGDMVDILLKYCKKDKRIKYHGVVPNDKVIEAQLTATLLVNPRPSNVEFVKFSFPSKNMEYMASGTPVVTTRLPGMPIEYYDYIFIFNEETVKGFAQTLNEILSLPNKALIEKGQSCKSFVLEKKNNIIQAGKVLELFQRV